MYSKEMFKKDLKQLKRFRIMSKFLKFVGFETLNNRVAWKRADLANKMAWLNGISEPNGREEEAAIMLEKVIREYYNFYTETGLGAIVCMDNAAIFIPAKCSK